MLAAVDDHARLVKLADNATAIRVVNAHRVQLVDLEVLANLENQDDKVREARLACPVFRFQCQHKIRDANDAHLDHPVIMARPDQLVKTDRKARLEIPAVMVVLAVRDQQDQQEMPANRDAMVNQAVLVHQAKVPQVDAKVHLEHQAKLAVQAVKVNVVQLELMANRAHQVKPVNRVHREMQAHQAVAVNQANRDHLEHPVMTLSIVRVLDAASLLVVALKATTIRQISRYGTTIVM